MTHHIKILNQKNMHWSLQNDNSFVEIMTRWNAVWGILIFHPVYQSTFIDAFNSLSCIASFSPKSIAIKPFDYWKVIFSCISTSTVLIKYDGQFISGILLSFKLEGFWRWLIFSIFFKVRINWIVILLNADWELKAGEINMLHPNIFS